MKSPPQQGLHVRGQAPPRFVLVSVEKTGILIECRCRKLTVGRPLPAGARLVDPVLDLMNFRREGWVVRHVFRGESAGLLELLFALNRLAGGQVGGWDSSIGEGLNQLIESVYSAGLADGKKRHPKK